MTTLQFIRQNFRFLAFGFTLSFMCNLGQTFFIGFYKQPLREVYNLSNGDFGALYGLTTLCGAGVLIWAGRLIDTVDLRHYTLWVIIFMILACGLMYLDAGIGAMLVAIFLLRLTGQGLMPHISSTSMGRYFDAARGRALGIANLGINLSMVALPAIAVYLTAQYGWRESWGIYALFLLLVVLPAVLLMLKGHGERHHKWQAEMTVAESQTGTHTRLKSTVRDNVLRDKRFYMIMPGFLSMPVFATGLFFFQEDLLASKGWDSGLFAYTMPFFAVTTTLSALFGGWLIDRIGGSLKALPYSTLPFALAMLLLSLAEHPAMMSVVMVLSGLSNGIITIVSGTLWAELYGTRILGAVRSLVVSTMILASAIAPAALGYIYDAGVSINAVFQFFAIYMVVTALVQLPLRTMGDGAPARKTS